MSANQNINKDIYYSTLDNVINIFNQMLALRSNCIKPYSNYLSGKLLSYYNSLNDESSEEINKIFNKIYGLQSVTNMCKELYIQTAKEDLRELESLINELYNQTDIITKEINQKQEEFINYEDYSYLYDHMDEIFDEKYADIIKKFKLNLGIGYQDFLENIVPSTIDNIIDNTYLRNSKEEIGNDKYYESLQKLKDSFAKNVLNNYNINEMNIEESNIPKYLWDEADEYHKSLLMLSYKGDFNETYEMMIKDSIIGACDNVGIHINDLGTFENNITQSVVGFNAINKYYNIDYDKELSGLSYKNQVKKILEITSNAKLPFELENERVSKYTMESAMFPNLGGNVDTGKCFVDTLKELGYFDNLSKEYDDKELFKNTFNYEFLTNIAVNEGTDKVYSVIEKYYDKCFKEYGYQDSSEKAKELAKNLFQDTPFTSNFTTANMTLKVLNNIDYSYNKLVNDKLTLDAAKSNYKLGLLENLDTSSLTNGDVITARKLIGNDAKYLDDWQIKGYYQIYLEDKERAKNLLNDTLYNIIQDGRGYEKAKNIYNLMTGEEQKKLMNQVIHNEIFNDIWSKTSGGIITGLQGFSDGVVGSIRNVGDLLLADGKMDSRDYYLSYLQEMLSAGGTHNDILKLEYNLSSGAGNMLIPMALSAFVSPHAMSAWIFAAETGSSREQALRGGAENDVGTFLNAAAKGVVAVGVEKTLGALKGYGSKSDDLLSIFTNDNKYITKLMETSFGKKFALGLSNSVNETIEELVENAGGYGIDFLTGRDVDLQGIPEETWETIYMTLLTTPLINMMGGSLQNSKYSTINRMNTYHLDGFDIECSQAELLRFTDSQGYIDNKELFNFLFEHDRIFNIVEENLLKDELLHLYSGDEQKKLYGHILGEDYTLPEIDTFKSNPTKENSDRIFEILGETLVYHEYINAARKNDVQNPIFDAIILHYDLENKYPDLTREEIIENLMKSYMIPRDVPNAPIDLSFELKQLDNYYKEYQENHKYKKFREFINYEEYCSKYKLNAQKWYDNLSLESKQLFYKYTRGEIFPSAAKVMNPILRGIAFQKDGSLRFVGTSGKEYVYDSARIMNEFGISTDDFVEMVFDSAEKMMEEADKFKLTEPTIIYRGVNWDSLSTYGINEGDSVEQIYKKLTKTVFYRDPGFMSATPVLENKITTGKPILFKLHCVEETSIIDLSAINPGEREVLFPPGVAFHVDSVSLENGQLIVNMTSIPSESSKTIGDAIKESDVYNQVKEVKKVIELNILTEESFIDVIDKEDVDVLTRSMIKETSGNDVLFDQYEYQFYEKFLESKNKVKYAAILIETMIKNNKIDNIDGIIWSLDENDQQRLIQAMIDYNLSGVDIIKDKIQI